MSEKYFRERSTKVKNGYFYFYLKHEFASVENIIDELKNIEKGKDYKEYENFCTDIMVYLFSDNLADWEEQYRLDDACGNKIMDALCTVTPKNEFWKVFSKKYNSEYLIFEYKNINGEIKCDEIEKTRKYFNKNVGRSVCIFVSRDGLHKNALSEARSIYRDSGEFFIPICDDDLIEMIKLKKDEKMPEEHLRKVIDNFRKGISK